MDSEPQDVEKQASAIAHEYFWCVAGRHQACIEQLQESFGTVPYELWLNLCFESIVFGLGFFGEYARRHYTASEQELFVSELDTATRWLLATTLFDPGDIGPPPSQAPQSLKPIRSRWILTKGHERALAPFTRWCEARRSEARLNEVRHSQFHRRSNKDPRQLSVLLANVFRWRSQGQTNPQSDSSKFFEELKTDLAREGYSCPESVLHVFVQGVVNEAYRIRDEAASRLKGVTPTYPLARTG